MTMFKLILMAITDIHVTCEHHAISMHVNMPKGTMKGLGVKE